MRCGTITSEWSSVTPEYTDTAQVLKGGDPRAAMDKVAGPV
jgi:hypothetical protein